MKTYIIIIILTTGLIAQKYVPRNILIQSKTGVTMDELKIGLDISQYQIVKPLMDRANIYLVKVMDRSITTEVALKEISDNPWVQNAQLDHYITQRQTFPNDPSFNSQWACIIRDNPADWKTQILMRQKQGIYQQVGLMQ